MAPKFKNVRIPKLETVLERMKEKVAMNIELKTESRVSPGMKPADIVRPVLELVKKKELELAVMVSSFDHQLVDEVKRQNPKIICAYLIEGGEDQLRPDTLRQKGIEGMNPRWDLVDEAVVADYRSRGVGVYVWGSDDSPRILNELIDMGVSGIFTNKPAVMLGLLKARSSR
jgi:glycerophosphoryl diester phosphodiesterase